ncbi:MAG: GatB/YqeY domain-containing protein [Patescibacteria group bacterium]
MIHENLKGEVKKAMLAKDELRLSVIRGLIAAFTNELVAKRRQPQEMLSDEEALAVITRQVKQRKDSIEQFTAGGRPDLAGSEKAELAILEAFLPEMMSEEEVRKVVVAKKAEMGLSDKAEAGKFTGVIMKELKGKADGSLVKKIVDELFT